ncbi:hypothetical protein OG874_35590 [Nocardia sp. NBC_00565]|uniref:hypothetical protein n=1 Tax=Nocardia sp. NBC_00565 TaxID=2975993 RepID=UPI002E807164|nr:hypothetical protein [Nocardia sp. NBC_00565]WUC02014.1 hypothetical protein OG874_35590 [Nocardia sp. NBC_00565]
MITWALTTVITSTGAERTVDGHSDDRPRAVRAVTAAARTAVANVHHKDILPIYVLTVERQTISILSTGRDSQGKPDRYALLAAIDQIEARSTT